MTTACTLIDLDALLALWGDPPPAGPAGDDDFRRFYADPCVVNGKSTRVSDLAAGARVLQAALAASQRELLACHESAGTVVFAFALTGRHVGPLRTSAGTVAPTGAEMRLRVIDILTVVDGLVTDVIMVADELGALVSAGAVTVG